MKSLYVFFVIAVLIGLQACQSAEKDDWESLTVRGVSRELAVFRKDNYQDIKYNLSFFLPESKNEPVSGQTDISFTVLDNMPLIVDFRGEPEQIHAVYLNGVEAVYTFSDEHIVIETDFPEPTPVVVTIDFQANDQSLNRRDEFMYTLLVPDRARTLFPCFDQPDLKALYTLTLELPSGWQAVANGAVRDSSIVEESGRKRISFAETEPLSTYLFSFVAGQMTNETYTRGERSISVYHRETDMKKAAQCRDIAGEVFDALEWMEEYTAIPYPFAKYDLIILPGFQYGGMEHTGATLYNDRRMFLNEQPTLNERLSRSALIAHETAHMWFGDYVTMEWFDDVWLKEIFANYYAAKMVEPLYPDINHELNFIRNYIPAAYSEDRTAGTNPIKQDLGNLSDAGLVYGQIIYNKSPIVLEMLISRMGEEAFRLGIREYLNTYAYGNATWDNLVDILDARTDYDLKSWSRVWVNEKGMPEISCEIDNNQLGIIQTDPWNRGLSWPQTFYNLLISGNTTAEIPISLEGKTTAISLPDSILSGKEGVIIPNSRGNGYGFFRMNQAEAEACLSLLGNSHDDVLRGTLLINLFENLINLSVDPQWYMDGMLKYISNEKNTLLFNMALGYIGQCQLLFIKDSSKTEDILWNIISANSNPQHRLLAFRSYMNLASTPESIERLYTIWKGERSPDGCRLSESDFITLSYKLSLYNPERFDEIITQQRSRITNPDRRKEYDYISPSVSPDKAVRDSVFTSLLIPENRRIEPWASAALGYLNHRSRQADAVSYIRPALNALEEVQRTGDIFFPASWLRSLLAGHNSLKAKKEIDTFFADHPGYSPMLSNKIKQQADNLYRFAE